MTVDGVEVIDQSGASEAAIRKYISEVESKINETIHKLTIKPEGEEIRLEWERYPPKFERIRRITGYLVGTIDRWNNAKKDEERERVKHG